jgi:hypothetical protein
MEEKISCKQVVVSESFKVNRIHIYEYGLDTNQKSHIP